VNPTDHPTTAWTARQIVEAFPEETAPTCLLRNRDTIYGEAVARCVNTMEIRQGITAPRAPWQNPFAERVIGSIRRECLDHVMVLSETHLRRLPACRRRLRQHRASRSSARQPLSTARPGAAASAQACGGHPAGRRASSPRHPRRLIGVGRRASRRPLVRSTTLRPGMGNPHSSPTLCPPSFPSPSTLSLVRSHGGRNRFRKHPGASDGDPPLPRRRRVRVGGDGAPTRSRDDTPIRPQ
jgi:hypothetical protein